MSARLLRNGVIAYKIAAHAADIALKRPTPATRDRDDAISRARGKPAGLFPFSAIVPAGAWRPDSPVGA